MPIVVVKSYFGNGQAMPSSSLAEIVLANLISIPVVKLFMFGSDEPDPGTQGLKGREDKAQGGAKRSPG